MNEKKPANIPVPPAPALPGHQAPVTPETQWVMVFNLLTKAGKEEQKKTFKVNKKRIVIGSALSSDIRIQQNSVSNVHAVIEMDDAGVAHIYDMASETGVFLNEKKTVAEELKDGDEIKIGFATLTYKRQSLTDTQAQLPKAAVRSSGARTLFLNDKEDFRPLILEDERNVIQIFDYPASSEQALQVVMYWGEVILNVQHFTPGEAVTIGESKAASFLVPGMHTDFPLVGFEEGGIALRFTDEMTGVVRQGKQVLSLDQMREKNGQNRAVLKNTDDAKVQYRGVTFFLSTSPLPPVLRRQKVLERDPFYTRIWFSSLGLTVALVLLMMGMEKPEPLAVDELPPRVATMIFKPIPPVEVRKPEPKPEPKVEPPKTEEPKPVAEKKPEPPKKLPTEPKKAQVRTAPTTKPVASNQVKGQAAKPAGGDEGEGARAAGAEGRKGRPNAPKADRAQVQSKGNPNANTAQKSETTSGKGNVESLLGDLQGSINKNLAAGGKGASAAGEKLRGYGGFTTQGNGGLGNLGTGAGGGGTSQSLSQGLGTKGLGEGAQGKGLGAIGSGGNILGTGRGRPSVEVGNAQETVIMGGLDKDLIDSIIRKYMPQIRYCYEKEANAMQGALQGRVLVQFTIASSGRVSQAGVKGTSLQNANVERCLTGVIQRIVFPEPLGGGVVDVEYPFLFAPAFSGR